MSDETPTPGEPEQLGDAGKKAIAAERSAREAAEKALKDANVRLKQLEDAGKSELEKLQTRLSEVEQTAAKTASDAAAKDLTILRQQIGIKQGLPESLIQRLQGDTEESILADATALKGLIPDSGKPAFPKADPSQGVGGSRGAATPAQQFAEVLSSQLGQTSPSQ